MIISINMDDSSPFLCDQCGFMYEIVLVIFRQGVDYRYKLVKISSGPRPKTPHLVPLAKIYRHHIRYKFTVSLIHAKYQKYSAKRPRRFSATATSLYPPVILNDLIFPSMYLKCTVKQKMAFRICNS